MTFQILQYVFQLGFLIILLFISNEKFVSLTAVDTKPEPHGVLIINNIDGSFVGIDVSSGSELWSIKGSPLVSQSLSNLELITKTRYYKIVPSLSGQLYLFERHIDPNISDAADVSLRALPLTIESLFSSNFVLTENSILTGGREHSAFAFNPITGKVKYNCTKDGCDGNSSAEDLTNQAKQWEPTLLVNTVNSVVRAINAPLGIEKWNLSIRQHNLCLLSNRIQGPLTELEGKNPICGFVPYNQKFTEPDELNLDFELENDSIRARTTNALPEEIWSVKLKSRITKAWIYRTDTNSVKTISVFQHDRTALQLATKMANLLEQSRLENAPKHLSRTAVSLFSRYKKPVGNCPPSDSLVYLGDWNGQLYVQLADLDSPPSNWLSLSKSVLAPNTPDSNNLADSSKLTGFYQTIYSPTTSAQSQIPNHRDKLSTALIPTTDEFGYPFQFMQNQPKETVQQHNKQSNLGSNFPVIIPSELEDPSDDEQSLDDRELTNTNDLLRLLLHANDITINQVIPQDPHLTPASTLTMRLLQIVVLSCVIFVITNRIMAVKIKQDLRPKTLPIVTIDLKDSNYGTMESSESETVPLCQACSTPNASLQNADGESRRPSMSATTNSNSTFSSIFDVEFKYLRLLGRGGFGQVFEVENRFDGCRYAIKRIKMTEQDEEREKFLREVKALARLDHPGIVRYHRAWLECPPEGWQEARDLEVMGNLVDDTGTDLCSNMDLNDSATTFDNGTDLLSNYQLGNESKLFEYSESSLIQPTYLPSDNDDSLIVFEKPQSVQIHSNPSSAHVCSDHGDHSSVDKNSRRTPDESKPSLTTCYLYIQMQLCLPKSLRDWLEMNNKPESRPPRTELYSMFRQIVDAVNYLHRNSLMHRDLKPSNILFDLTNRLKLADFGLVTSIIDEDEGELGSGAKASEVPLGDSTSLCSTFQSGSNYPTRNSTSFDWGSSDSKLSCDSNGSVMTGNRKSMYHSRKARRHTNHVGTDLYMSPEQERGDVYDHKVDIFSLGLILLELLMTFETAMERICTLSRAKMQILPEEFKKTFPDETKFILNLLDPKPCHRPSASKMLMHSLLKQPIV